MNLLGLVTGFMAGVVFYPLFGPLGLLLLTLAGVMLESVGRRPGGFGSETADFVVRLFSLWGTLTGRAELTEAQGLFLRSVAAQLQVPRPLARTALAAFEQARTAVQGRPWPEVVALLSSTAKDFESFFLDRGTLLWIYASSRRLAALGVVRPGIAELLDVLARAFSILDDVGPAGLGSQGEAYEKAWKSFKPGHSASPEAYSVLGVSADASVDDIKRAYRMLVRQNHPDALAGRSDAEKARAAEKFVQIQQAYERVRRSRRF